MLGLDKVGRDRPKVYVITPGAGTRESTRDVVNIETEQKLSWKRLSFLSLSLSSYAQHGSSYTTLNEARQSL